MSKLTYLSLGSNMGDREAALRLAIDKLHSENCRVERVSSVFETAPMYNERQGKFLNLIVEVSTTLRPVQLLLRTANIEREMGRQRAVRNEPRPIDIDLVLVDQIVVDTPHLQIPHPRMAERRFVMEPLAELAPSLRHPVTKHTMSELLAALPSDGLVHRTAIHIAAPVMNSQV